MEIVGIINLNICICLFLNFDILEQYKKFARITLMKFSRISPLTAAAKS
jgi:hypothetical protein